MRVTTRRTRLEELADRTIFMSTFNDIDWTKSGNLKGCFSHSETERDCAKKFRKRGHQDDPIVKFSGLVLRDNAKL